MAQKEEKRRPLLIDRCLHADKRVDRSLVDRHTIEQFKGRLRQTRRFVFNDAAVDRYAQVVREVPDLIAQHQAFARAPFPVTWIEFDFSRFFVAANQRELEDSRGDSMMGFLIDHGRAYTVVASHPEYSGTRGISLMPIVYDLHTPWEMRDQIAFSQDIGTSRVGLDNFFWGEAVFRLAEDYSSRALRAAHSARWLPMNPLYPEAKTKLVIGQETCGDLRNIVTALLLLNRPSLTRYVEDIPSAKRFVGGKLRQYLSHTVVSIDIDPVPTIRMIGSQEGNGVTRRRHEVRGTWCHDKTSREYRDIAGCIHNWRPDPRYVVEDDPNDPDHWVCAVCEGRRWWRSEHHRGSSLVGFSAHDGYEVKG